ncbi:MAG: hypothetical protein WA999_17490 [Spirulinaceae cyanobacterium]
MVRVKEVFPPQSLKVSQKVARKLKRKLEHRTEDLVRTLTQRHIWSEVVNQQEIRIVGLKRTGNHAIINWLEPQGKGKIKHINNLQVNVNPYRYKYERLRDYYPEHQWSMQDYEKEARGNLVAKDLLLYSYEDYELKKVFSDYFESKHDLYLGKSAIRYDLLILRDPFNLFASRVKKNYLDVQNHQQNMVDLWIEYAEEFLGKTSYLKHNKVCLNYNRWVEDVDYRKEISAQLNLEFSDAGIDKVSGCGDGSSFEGRSLNGKAAKMDVNNRWQHFLEDESYRDLMNNEQLVGYSEQIFGHIPGTEKLRTGK